MESIVHLLNEIGMLAHTPRSGFAFLGTGKQSVAEHSHRMALVAYVLAVIGEEPVDISKLLIMCLCHDLPEARTGDLNYVNKRYVKADENKVIEEMGKATLLGKIFAAYLNEYIEGETLEAQLAHDADQIELLLVLKELIDTGNMRANRWFENVEKRVETKIGKQLARVIHSTPSDGWWIEHPLIQEKILKNNQ